MGNFIQVTDRYAIASDSKQWQVQKSKNVTNKDTKEVTLRWDGISFHSSLSRAVNSLGNLMLRSGDANSLTELVTASTTISNLLNKVFATGDDIDISKTIEE